MFPLHPGRRARQRVIVVARAASWKWMERLTRTRLRGRRLDRRHLQGAAHRPRGEGVRHPLHDDARRSGSAGRCRRRAARIAIRSRRVLEAEDGQLLFSGKMQRRGAADDGGLPARHARARRARRLPGSPLRARLPERVRGRLAGRRAARDDAGPHLRDGQRVGRGHRHRDAALRPARHASSPCPRRRCC